MEYKITSEQKSDMGSGFGIIEGAENHTLEDVLDFIEDNSAFWGTITILNDIDTIRKFDYNTYNDFHFYHHLSGWLYNFKVLSVEFKYCFMERDFTISLI